MTTQKIWFATLLVFLLVGSINYASAQQRDSSRVALKTNPLLWITASPNLGLEAALGEKWTLDLSGSLNPFTFPENRKWKHWQLTLEPRFWFGNRFRGHFVGAHVGGGEFNVGNVNVPFAGFDKAYRHEGWHLRGGLSYGYDWVLSDRWRLETELGLGVVYADYKQFKCVVCGDFEKQDSQVFFAPTRMGVTLVYTIGKKHPRKDVPQNTVTVLRDTMVVYRDRPVPVTVKETVKEEVPAIERMRQQYSFLVHENDTIPAHRGLSVRYRLGSSVLDADYLDNWQDLAVLNECIRELSGSMTEKLTHITIVGYASPDGDRQSNEQLAADRAEALRQYIAEETGVCDCKITAASGGEDWEGLRQLVVKSDMRLKEAVLDIIDNAPEDERKQRLQQLDGGRPWQSIKDVLFPELRNACYINVWYDETNNNN